jgi:hypothetical protein
VTADLLEGSAVPARCVVGQGAHPLHEPMLDVWGNALPIPSTGTCPMCGKMQTSYPPQASCVHSVLLKAGAPAPRRDR